MTSFSALESVSAEAEYTSADGSVIVDGTPGIPFILDSGADRSYVSKRMAPLLLSSPGSTLIQLARAQPVRTATRIDMSTTSIRAKLRLSYPSGTIDELDVCDVYVLDGLEGESDMLIGRPAMEELGYLSKSFPGRRSPAATGHALSSRSARMRFNSERTDGTAIGVVLSPSDYPQASSTLHCSPYDDD
jgi:hypothetical protein